MSGKKVRKLKTEKEMETEHSTAKKGQGEVGRPEENGPETGQRKKDGKEMPHGSGSRKRGVKRS